MTYSKEQEAMEVALTYDKKTLLQMLTYRRPEGSLTQQLFCEKFLVPVMGAPDPFDNYIKIVFNKDGSAPNVCFTAHHDTVHRQEGIQRVTYDPHMDVAYVDDTGSNCLGADCTTGVWLILAMIQAKVPGIYVVHAGEEIGCVGSTALVKNYPSWLMNTEAVISFDRLGTKSVITHQMGRRTASDSFATSLAEALGMPDLLPDSGGAYTDSNEYIDVVGECTNLSVGYYKQHTANEYQDMDFAMELRDALIKADWSKLRFERLAGDLDYDDSGWYSDFRYSRSSSTSSEEPETLLDVIWDYPDEVAALLEIWGFSVHDLHEGIRELEGYTGATNH